MYDIKLQITENGVIKSIKDDNSDGNGKLFTKTKLYILNSEEEKQTFLKDICWDIGISGNQVEPVLENLNLPPTIESKEKKLTLWQKIKQVFS